MKWKWRGRRRKRREGEGKEEEEEEWGEGNTYPELYTAVAVLVFKEQWPSFFLFLNMMLISIRLARSYHITE